VKAEKRKNGERRIKKMAVINVRYLSGGKPHSVGAGRVLVHNHVQPQPILGLNDFRAWTQRLDDSLVVCHCDWAGVKLPVKVHYRVRSRLPEHRL
jgi:hypothetical protein